MASILQRQLFQSIQSINLIDDKEKRDSIFQDLTGIEKTDTKKIDFKKHGISSNFIFSYSAVKNLCSFSKDFAKFLQNRGVAKVWKITPQLAKSFLDYKKQNGASDRTLITYKNQLIKIDIAIKNNFHCRGFCRGEDNIKNYQIEKPQPIDRRLSNEQIKEVLDNYRGVFYIPMLLQSDFGLRVDEVKNISINDFNFNQGQKFVKNVKQGWVNSFSCIHLINGTKGGLDRYIPIPADKIEQYKKIIDRFRQQGIEKPFQKLDRQNYNKAIKNIAFKCGFGKVGSSHEFRKYWASTTYQASINENMTEKEKKEVARKIISQLGHGRRRDDLIRIYIGNL